MGPAGRAGPANIVVDAELERGAFGPDGSARNRKKRFYYYSATVLNTALVSPVFSSLIKPLA
jgi:hypothetical protein